jgi:hypothetical protein
VLVTLTVTARLKYLLCEIARTCQIALPQ